MSAATVEPPLEPLHITQFHACRNADGVTFNVTARTQRTVITLVNRAEHTVFAALQDACARALRGESDDQFGSYDGPVPA